MRPTAPAAGLLALFVSLAPAAAQSTTRVSVSTAGAQGDLSSGDPTVSGDGRYVAFYSSATTLVPGDSNLARDIFVRDTLLGTTTRVSISTAGVQANGLSEAPTISADGRYVAFHSDATNLVSGDSNLMRDVFVRDTVANTTTRVSVSSTGAQGNGISSVPSISADGRYIVFESYADNLTPGDDNLVKDVFLRDTQLGTTIRVSVSSSEADANALSGGGRVSGDGRYVAFYSDATNLVSGDSNNQRDCFVRDTVAGTTTRISVSTGGAQGDNKSTGVAISDDGRYVAFNSLATNLVPGDSNLLEDVFVRDTLKGTTTRVSLSTAGAQGNGISADPTISPDGRLVGFYSDATNLVAGDSNLVRDVFIRDTLLDVTRRVSVNTAGVQGNGLSGLGEGRLISSDDRFVAFYSDATNLVSGDSNLVRDAFLRDMSPWTDLGGALAGVSGDPLLVGTGTWLEGDIDALNLSNAKPAAVAALFVSFASTPVPLKGGVLQAFPIGLQVVLATDGSGAVPLPFPTPPGLPAGTALWFQYLIQDAAAVHGVAFSNAVKVVTP